MNARSVISLGTNTIRLLVVRDGDDGIVQLEHRATGTRLGEGIRERGALAPAAKVRTLAAVREFAACARTYDAALACIATSALRRASDARAFAADLHVVCGAWLDVLSGQAEAAATFRGATYGAAHGGARVAVLDIGGGSTECAVGRDGVLEAARSIEIGSVRLTERFTALGGGSPGAPARAAAGEARAELSGTLAPLAELVPIDRLVAVAGTALTMGAVAFGSDVDSVSGRVLSLGTIDATLEGLFDLDLAARRELPGMVPQRADVLAGGALILSEALRTFRLGVATLESNDLLLGYLLWDGRESNPDALSSGKF